jgi:hypothetical protein
MWPMRDMMEDVWIPTPSSPMVFTRCDISDKDYLAPESQINNPTSAVSEEELEEQVPLLLLCDSCRKKLEVFPFQKPII